MTTGITPAVQFSFAGGELSNALWSRQDLQKYDIGARILRNCVVHAHGGASNRPGLAFLDYAFTDNARSRLQAFEASSLDTYQLEFSNFTFRIFRNGGLIVYPAGHEYAGQVVVIESPYAIEHIADLKFTQSNDVMTITHEAYQARELIRYDHHDWRWTVISYDATILTPQNLEGAASGSNGDPFIAEALAYKVTAINAAGEESLPTDPVTVSQDLNYRGNTVELEWDAVTGAIQYCVYKGTNGIFGLIGTPPAPAFTDANISPDYSDSPPEHNNPFVGTNNQPRVSEFHEQRRIFAGTRDRPQTIWGSKSGDYKNFSKSTPARDNDAIEFTIASRKAQGIRHLVAMEDLIVFTQSAEWRVRGKGGDILSPSSIDPKPQSFYGASAVTPLVVGTSILFVQEKGSVVRDLTFSLEASRYLSNDLTILARHLFTGRTVVRWAYQQIPDSIVWVVLSDGSLVSLTYVREQQVWAWSRHDTAGYFEDVSVSSEGGEDAVYCVVRRKINGAWVRTIERMASRSFGDIEDAFFVDCGLVYDFPMEIMTIAKGTGSTPALFTITAHGLEEGDVVELRNVYGTRNGSSILAEGQFLVGPSPGDSSFSLTWPDGEPLMLSDWTEFEPGGQVRVCVTHVAGFDHLEGERVVVLADGYVVGGDDGEPLYVTDGVVALGGLYARAQVGLPYRSHVKSLDIEQNPAETGGRQRVLAKITVNVDRTRGIKVGASERTAREPKVRAEEGYYDPVNLSTGKIVCTPESDWGAEVSIDIIQDYPLPMTVIGLVPGIVYGGG